MSKKKKFKKLDVVSRGSEPLGSIDSDHSVCVRFKDFDDFMLTFSLPRTKKDERFSPYQILGKLEESVIDKYLSCHYVEDIVSVNYKKHNFIPEVQFIFEGFSYEVESKTLIIEYAFLSTAG